MGKGSPHRMSHSFSRSPQANIPRSSFNRSHGCKTTFDAGWLVPVFLDEALPGDTFSMHMTAFARLATPLRPFMDNLYLDSFFFAVPYRLLWSNWEKFNGAQTNPGDSTDFLVPNMTSTAGTGYLNGSIHDYMSIPTQIPGLVHNCLFHRAYNLIWNTWFRDENLQNSVTVNLGDGPDVPTDYALLRRGKRYDYFTSCLPWPQKGTAVGVPLGTTAPVYGIAARTTSVAVDFSASPAGLAFMNGNGVSVPAGTAGWSKDQVGDSQAEFIIAGNNTTKVPAIYADLSAATASTINSLRQAFQIQKLYERDARGGTRYIEILKSHFGVTSPDARLQRPEYLGGGSTPVVVNPIAQTSSTDAVTPQGNLAGFGTCSMSGHSFTKSFVEHCIIIGLVSARADLNYQQGLNKMFSRSIRWDYYWPALSHIGEQTVLNKEIYAVGSANLAQDAAVFGYQERYAEYRYKPSVITGQFRSNFATTLDSWHLAQNFTSLPVLNTTFIQETPPVDRVSAVPTYPDFLFDSWFKYHCARPMPVYAVPGLIDHF